MEAGAQSLKTKLMTEEQCDHAMLPLQHHSVDTRLPTICSAEHKLHNQEEKEVLLVFLSIILRFDNPQQLGVSTFQQLDSCKKVFLMLQTLLWLVKNISGLQTHDV